jgi:hypothetical protein
VHPDAAKLSMVGAPSTSMLVPLERRQIVDPAAIAVAPGANEPCRVRRARVATQNLLPVKATNRGDEAMALPGHLAALGRQEEWEDSPEGYPADSGVRVVKLARRVRRSRHAKGLD